MKVIHNQVFFLQIFHGKFADKIFYFDKIAKELKLFENNK